MKPIHKTILRNVLLIAAMLALAWPYVELTRQLSPYLRFDRFVPLLVYALLCGALFSLLDFSHRGVNVALFAAFAAICLAYIFLPMLEFFYPLGTGIYFFILMTGAMLPKLFQKG